MGKVKEWLMQVEEDAACMTLEEFLKRHPNDKDIWASVNNAEHREPDPSDLEPSQEEIDKHYTPEKTDIEDDDKLMKGVRHA